MWLFAIWSSGFCLALKYAKCSWLPCCGGGWNIMVFVSPMC